MARRERAPIAAAAAALNGDRIPAAPFNGPPNEELFKKALLVLWIVILYIWDIVLTSKRYLQQTPPTMRPQPPSLFDPSSTPEFIFQVSSTVSAVSLIAILRIMTVVGINWFAGGPRRLVNNRYHENILKAIVLANWILCIVRCITVQFVNDVILLLLIWTFLLLVAVNEGYLGMFLDWVKRMFRE